MFLESKGESFFQNRRKGHYVIKFPGLERTAVRGGESDLRLAVDDLGNIRLGVSVQQDIDFTGKDFSSVSLESHSLDIRFVHRKLDSSAEIVEIQVRIGRPGDRDEKIVVKRPFQALLGRRQLNGQFPAIKRIRLTVRIDGQEFLVLGVDIVFEVTYKICPGSEGGVDGHELAARRRTVIDIDLIIRAPKDLSPVLEGGTGRMDVSETSGKSHTRARNLPVVNLFGCTTKEETDYKCRYYP